MQATKNKAVLPLRLRQTYLKVEKGDPTVSFGIYAMGIMKRTIGVHLDDASRRIGTLRFDSRGARQSAANPPSPYDACPIIHISEHRNE